MSSFDAPPPPPRDDSNKKVVIGLLAGLMLCGIFSCCGFLGFIGYREMKQNQPLTGPIGSAPVPTIPPVESTNRLLVVPPYGGLSPTTTLHGEAGLQLQNTSAELYVLGFSEPKSAFPDGFTLERYGNAITEAMVVVGKTVSQPTIVSMGGLPARQSQIRGTLNGLPILYWLTVVQTEAHFHQLVIWTLATKEGEHAPTVQRIVTETVARSTP